MFIYFGPFFFVGSASVGSDQGKDILNNSTIGFEHKDNYESFLMLYLKTETHQYSFFVGFRVLKFILLCCFITATCAVISEEVQEMKIM